MTQVARTSIVKKITLADVMPSRNPKDLPGYDKDTEHFPTQLAMRVVGQVRGVEAGKTTFGDYWKFKGNFMAVNAKGEQFRSGVCILPDPASTLTKEAFDAGGGVDIQLAFDVLIAYDKGDRGYKYLVQPLVEAEPSDPLNELARQVGERFALPTPAQASLELASEQDEASQEPHEGLTGEPAKGKKTK